MKSILLNVGALPTLSVIILIVAAVAFVWFKFRRSSFFATHSHLIRTSITKKDPSVTLAEVQARSAQLRESSLKEITDLKTKTTNWLGVIAERGGCLAEYLTLKEINQGLETMLDKTPKRLNLVLAHHLRQCKSVKDFDNLRETFGISFTAEILKGCESTWLNCSQTWQEAVRQFSVLGEPKAYRSFIERFGWEALREAGDDEDKVRAVMRDFAIVYSSSHDYGDTYCPVYDQATSHLATLVARREITEIPTWDTKRTIQRLREMTVPTCKNRTAYQAALEHACALAKNMDFDTLVDIIASTHFYWDQTPVNATLRSCLENIFNVDTLDAMIDTWSKKWMHGIHRNTQGCDFAVRALETRRNALLASC